MGTLRSPGARRSVSARAVVGKTPRPSDMTARQRRAAGPALTKAQIEKHPDLPREICEVCSKHVPLRADGTLKGHQSSRGISCPGATPRF